MQGLGGVLMHSPFAASPCWRQGHRRQRKKNLSCSAPEPTREGGRRRREAQGLQPAWPADCTTGKNHVQTPRLPGVATREALKPTPLPPRAETQVLESSVNCMGSWNNYNVQNLNW